MRLGVKSLFLHKLRSFLAIIGIMFGVWAVISLVAIGEGISHQAQEQIKGLGATNVIVRSVKPATNSGQQGLFVTYGLLRSDFSRISETVPTVRKATPLRELEYEVTCLDRKIQSRVVGCTPEYLSMNNLEMANGRFLEDRDEDRRDNVCVIADETAAKLFPFQDPIGQTIQIQQDFYRVIGRTKDRTPTGSIGGSFSGQDYNKDIYIPLSTLRARFGDQVMISRSAGSREFEIVELSQITVTVGDIDEVEATEDMIRTLLEKYHKTVDYALIVPKELLRQAKVTQTIFQVFFGFIAGISLLVGGIGIMNIMLATVTERTREIGIRRALGAKQRDITLQFLSETVVLSATGGTMGVVAGLLCPLCVKGLQAAINEVMPQVMIDIPVLKSLVPLVAPWSVATAFLVSVLVGVIFGIYPAIRAARMDPIEALRHE